jgi:hypothetical protein
MLQQRAQPGEINGDMFDRFTIGHLAIGVLLGLVRAPWWVALPVAIGWELAENPLKDRFPKLFPHASHDTPANAVADVAAVTAGWASMRLLPRR